MEQANAPKQRSGSITAIFFGALLRGLFISLVHIGDSIIADRARTASAHNEARTRGPLVYIPEETICLWRTKLVASPSDQGRPRGELVMDGTPPGPLLRQHGVASGPETTNRRGDHHASYDRRG